MITVEIFIVDCRKKKKKRKEREEERKKEREKASKLAENRTGVDCMSFGNVEKELARTGISGWGCAAGTLEPLTYTRASSAEFCYPILE